MRHLGYVCVVCRRERFTTADHPPARCPACTIDARAGARPARVDGRVTGEPDAASIRSPAG